MIKAEKINYSYGKLVVLKDLDLHIERGESVSVIGASGAGKTTLLQLLGTLDDVNSGSITINNRKVESFSPKELANFRNKEIGFVFQFHNLLVEFTALENVCLPAFILGTEKSEAEKKGKELLDLLGLKDRLNHKPDELSGGEQQRVAVARALINSPSIILADEPSGNLDSKNAKELHNLFIKLNKELGQTFIVITHNKAFAELASRQLEMKDGKII